MPFARLSVQSLPGRALQRPFGLSSEWNGLFPGGWCRPRYRWRRRTIKPPDRNYDVLYGNVSPLFSSSDFTASAGQATPGPARGKGQRLRKCGRKCPPSYLNSGLPLSLVKGVILSSAKIRFNPTLISVALNGFHLCFPPLAYRGHCTLLPPSLRRRSKTLRE